MSCSAGLWGRPIQVHSPPGPLCALAPLLTLPCWLHLNLDLDLQGDTRRQRWAPDGTTALNIPRAGSRFTISKISHPALIHVIGNQRKNVQELLDVWEQNRGVLCRNWAKMDSVVRAGSLGRCSPVTHHFPSHYPPSYV